MRLESAMFSSREGLTSHGQALSVVSDNLANSNTTGFKTNRVEFIDILSEGEDGFQSTTLPGAGTGVAVSRVRALQENGAIEATGRDLDVAIEGRGFFIVGDTDNAYYSRAGNFSIDGNGLLVNSDGLPVLGYVPGSEDLSTLNVIDINLAGTPTSRAKIVGNLDSGVEVTAAPADPQTFAEVNDAASFVSAMESIDSLGNSHNIQIAFFKTAANTWVARAYIDGGDVGGAVGVPKQVGSDVNLPFNTFGDIEEANKAAASMTIAAPYSNGAAAGSFKIDLSGFTQVSTVSQVFSITQDGQTTGNIEKYAVDDNGTLNAVLNTGRQVEIGRIPLALFNNVDGLDRIGSTLFDEGPLAGTAAVGVAGAEGRGGLVSGSLERSTVDIATQFIDLVLYQRGYQANSQSFSTVNQLLQQTVGLLR